MDVFDKLGDTIGKTFSTLFSNVSGLLKFKVEQLEDVNKEISGASLDPEKFKTKEVKKLAEKIKESLSHSPAGPADWIQGIMGGFMADIWDVAISILLPEKMETFEDAKASATWLTNLFADFVILSAVLDMVGTAFSATLVRNLIHIFRLFAATFGMDRYLDACIAPALTSSIVPRLNQGYNAQYQTFWPPVPDWVRYARRDIFSDDVVEFYDYMGNYPEEQEGDVAKAGLNPEFWKYEWMAHWRDIEWSIANLLLHRGKITPEQHGMILRTANYPPGILKWMTECSWDLPNRIETRMMARYGLVDKEWLVGHLERIGLHEDYRSIAADFMLAMGIRMDVSARYSKGWIKKEEVKTEIDATGLSPEIADRLYMWIVKNVGPEQVEETRSLTKTEIYKGIKAGTISPEQGVELLMDMNYDRETAEYLVEVNVGVLAGSPETFEEFKGWTQDWRRAAGLEAKPMSEEIKTAAAEVVRLTAEVEALTQSIEEEERGLVAEEVLPEEATKRLKSLQVKRNRAESKLSAAKSEYDRLVAEWKH